MNKIIIKEQDLKGLITSVLLGNKSTDSIKNILSQKFGDEVTNKLIQLIQDKIKKPEESDYNTKFKSDSKLDLNTSSGFRAYKEITDRFIQSRSSNLLGITGEMMANAAKNALNRYGSYVPPELALSQLAQEGGFSTNPNARPIRTKNPFNVGNVDSGKNVRKGDVRDGINDYYNLIAKKYLVGGKTMDDLLTNFVNSEGKRYASSISYESSLKNIINGINKISQPIYANLNSGINRNLA